LGLASKAIGRAQQNQGGEEEVGLKTIYNMWFYGHILISILFNIYWLTIMYKK
jgi:hypothetical protein